MYIGAFGSVDSLDKLGGEVWSGSGISLLTAPEWSSEQVAHWLQRVGLGKHSDGATEKGFSGRQLMELDSGKIKVRCILPVESGVRGEGEVGERDWECIAR